MKQELVAVQTLEAIIRREWSHEYLPSIAADTVMAKKATNVDATIDWIWTKAKFPITIFVISL